MLRGWLLPKGKDTSASRGNIDSILYAERVRNPGCRTSMSVRMERWLKFFVSMTVIAAFSRVQAGGLAVGGGPPGGEVTSIAFDPTDSSTIYVGTHQSRGSSATGH